MWGTLNFLCSLLRVCAAHVVEEPRPRDLQFSKLETTRIQPPNDSYSEPTSNLTVRWYGVAEHESENVQSPYNFAWPMTCTNPVQQPVRYCYKNARSAMNLKGVVEAAIARWSVAIEHTSLSIIQDPRCSQDMCLCSDLPADARDALMIADKTRKSIHPPQSNDPAVIAAERAHNKACATGATVGYDYIAPGEPDRPFRHKLNVCALDPYDPEGTFEMAVVFVMHELGHVFGLRHEHQRPDRGQYLAFLCQNLRGFAEAEAIVMADPKKLFRAPHLKKLNAQERMRYVCTRAPYSDYMPELRDFLPEDRNKEALGEAKVESSQFSEEFDYSSMMIYSDKQGSANKKSVFKRKDPKTGQIVEGRIFQGGMSSSRDWQNAKPSEGDAARLAQLYDAHTEECEKQKKGTKNWATKYVVKAGSSKETIVPPPTKSRARTEREALELRKRSEL